MRNSIGADINLQPLGFKGTAFELQRHWPAGYKLTVIPVNLRRKFMLTE
jgi:hypothetical protein